MTNDLRAQMRAQIFASETCRGKVKKLTFFGTEIEIRQPTIGQVQKWSDSKEGSVNLIDILLDFAYVPDTDVKVFESADRDTLATLPMDSEAAAVMKAIEDFSNLVVKDAEKN